MVDRVKSYERCGRKARRRWVALTAAVLLLAASCSNSKKAATTNGAGGAKTTGAKVSVSEPGVTDTEIRVGGVAAVTNPLGMKPGASFDGVQAFFDMVNADGGIYGRKVVLASKRDDNFSNNLQQVQGLISQDHVFAALPMATTLFTGAKLLASSGIPTFGWNINVEWGATKDDPRSNMFGHAGSFLCGDCLQPGMVLLAKQAGLHKVGIVSFNVAQAQVCATSMRNTLKQWGSEAGVSLAFVDTSVGFGSTDYSVQAQRMKDAGVDLIVPCLDQQSAITLAKSVKKQGLHAKILLLQGYDKEIPQDFGDLFEGSYVQMYFEPIETAKPSPGMQKFLEWTKKGGYTVSENTVTGWLNAALFYEGLKDAGPRFTQKKVIDAINKMKDWTAGGMLAGVDWTKAHTSLAESCLATVQVKNGAFVPALVHDGKPFTCVPTKASKTLPTPEYRG